MASEEAKWKELGNRIGELCDAVKSAALNMLQPSWIPVGERLPEDGQEVLVCYPGGVRCSGRLTFGVWHLDDDQLGGPVNTSDITHWMPLPEPPKP